MVATIVTSEGRGGERLAGQGPGWHELTGPSVCGGRMPGGSAEPALTLPTLRTPRMRVEAFSDAESLRVAAFPGPCDRLTRDA